MTNATPSRLGFTDGTSDTSFAQDNELFLVEFSGMVLSQFETMNVFKDLHEVRTIKSGKSAQFVALGRTTAAYHTPGTELLGKTIKHNQRLIHIDGRLVSDVFVDDLDEAKNHYEVKSKYAKEIAGALSRGWDQRVARLIALAARSSATVNGGNGGSTINGANFKTSGSDLAEGILTALQTLDEKDVPDTDRYVGLLPAQFYLLLKTTRLLEKEIGGIGVYSEGNLTKIGGATIVKSNHVPSTSVSAVSGENNTYSGNFSTTAALVWHKEAVGTVKLMDLNTEIAWDPRRRGHLLIGEYAMGSGIIRPECAIELRTADPPQ